MAVLQDEPEEYWSTKGEREGANPLAVRSLVHFCSLLPVLLDQLGAVASRACLCHASRGAQQPAACASFQAQPDLPGLLPACCRTPLP